MSFQFRRAIREEVGLLIGLMGASGTGKTYSAMRLASGICGDKPFAVIDTEARRALHYADQFRFDHGELHAPFRPDAYLEAIMEADKAKYGAIVVDSMSHEWTSEGGIIEWQEEELTRMAGDDYRKREACKMAAWIKPKQAHKKMVQRLLQINATLILCFRAEEKMKMEKDQNGKTVIVPIGFQPICSKELPYELLVSFMLTPDKPGIPQPLKLQSQHKPFFPLDKEINEESGRLIAEWARGGKAKEPAKESLYEVAAHSISECESLDALAAYWKAHSKDFKTDPRSKEITAAKDARKKALSTVRCPETLEDIPAAVCADCSKRDGCSEAA